MTSNPKERPRAARRRRRLFAGNTGTYLALGLLVLLFVAIFLAPRSIIVIRSGEVGVKYDLITGTQVDRIYGEGLNIIAPWNRMYIYNIRVQETKRTLNVLTADGLVIQLDLSIRYHPEVSMVGVLHAVVGPNYVDTIVVPEVESTVRSSVGKLTAEQLYTGVPNKSVTPAAARAEGIAAQAGAQTPETEETPGGAAENVPPGDLFAGLPNQLQQPPPAAGATPAPAAGATPVPPVAIAPLEESRVTPIAPQTEGGQMARADLIVQGEGSAGGSLAEIIRVAIMQVSQKYILIDDVIITRSVIPDYLQQAIQEKLQQKEMAKAQEYRLEQAKIEFQIKQVEDLSNQVIRRNLSPEILRLRGIEATRELATSPNAKVVVVGNGEGQLPIILGAER